MTQHDSDSERRSVIDEIGEKPQDKSSAGERSRAGEGAPQEVPPPEGSSLSGEGCPPPSFGARPRREAPEAAADQGRPRLREPEDGLARIWRLFWDTFRLRYWDFSGRAGRTEFWVFFIGSLAISAFLNALAALPFIGFLAALASIAWWIASLVPTWSAAFRRLHDTGRSGWWVSGPLALLFALLFLFPASLALSLVSIAAIGPAMLAAGVLFVVALVFCALPGQKGPNAWGEAPDDLHLF